MESFLKKIENYKNSLWTIIAFAFAIRFLFLLVKPDIMSADHQTYFKAGQSLFETGLISSPKVMPLFPIVSYALGGGFILKFFNVLCGTAIVFMAYFLTLNILHSRRMGLLAALLTAIYPFYIFQSATGLSEPLYSLLIYTSLALLYQRNYLLSFTVAGLSILVRPFFELIFPIILFSFVFLIDKQSLKFTFKKIGQYLLIYTIVMIPWWAHNYQKYDQFVRLNLGDGISFYVGNVIEDNFKYGVNFGPRGEVYDVPKELEAEFGNDTIKRNQILKREVKNFILNHPDKFIERALIKLVRLYRPIPDSSNFGKKKVYLLASVLSYIPVILLALASFFFLNKELFIRFMPIWLLTSFTTAVHCVTIANIRYRLPIDFFFIILASYSMILIIKKYFPEKK